MFLSEDGLELPDLDAAIATAIHNARDVMAGEVKAGRLCLSCAIAIEDEQHRQVGWVPFREALRVSGL